MGVNAHVGVKSNEREDRLPGLASMDKGRAAAWADVLNAFKEVGRVRDTSDDCKSATMDRLLEHSIKRSIARHEGYVKSHRKLVSSVAAGGLGRWGNSEEGIGALVDYLFHVRMIYRLTNKLTIIWRKRLLSFY